MSEDFAIWPIGMELTRHGLPVLSIQVSVNLVKEVEWRWVAFLNRKDCKQGRGKNQCESRRLAARFSPVASATSAFCPPESC